MKKPSGQLIQEALAAERKRIIRLLEALKRGYYLTGDVKGYQAINKSIATIERNS